MVPLPVIHLATLCSGAQRFHADNATETWKGPIQTEQGQRVAFVKVLPDNQLISEAACALLARALCLDVPIPYLVQVNRDQLKASKKWAKDEAQKICFGSEELVHPSLVRVLVPKRNGKPLPVHPDVKKKIWEKIRACEGFQETAIFDEWVANGDRHDGNLLWDGKKFYLIDHSHALTGGKWKPSTLKVDAVVPNKLLDSIAKGLSWEEREQWSQKAEIQRFRYQDLAISTLPDMAKMEIYDQSGLGTHAVNFFEKRINKLLQLICSRLGLGVLPI
ncbi:MAG TPA: HipA family kinase [Nitrospira sp.]|nr:HipA family kinase [Nitrospira sp.]